MILYVLFKYLRLKRISPAKRGEEVRRCYIFSGKAHPRDPFSKKLLVMILKLSTLLNNDKDTSTFLKLVYFPNYSISLEEVLFPAADVGEQNSTAAQFSSGISLLKIAFNGGLICSTVCDIISQM